MGTCGLVKTSRETSVDTLTTKLGLTSQKNIGTFVHIERVGLCNHASQTR